jgi:hypothetical protein
LDAPGAPRALAGIETSDDAVLVGDGDSFMAGSPNPRPWSRSGARPGTRRQARILQYELPERAAALDVAPRALGTLWTTLGRAWRHRRSRRRGRNRKDPIAAKLIETAMGVRMWFTEYALAQSGTSTRRDG